MSSPSSSNSPVVASATRVDVVETPMQRITRDFFANRLAVLGLMLLMLSLIHI